MFIELIDLLRCPVEHEESWLVAAFTRMDGRFVIEGKLGCPVCSASYPITDGVAHFAPALPRGERLPGHASADDDDVVRIAALLGLVRAGMAVVIEGADGVVAPALTAMAGSRIIAVNSITPIPEGEGICAVTAEGRFPLASRSVDGVVLGPEPGSLTVDEAARVLKPGGRLVGPASLDYTGGFFFRELARDERNVVLESPGQIVKLGSPGRDRKRG